MLNGMNQVGIGSGPFILPSEIQAMLKRKSSRDPNSRFSNKLHMLLDYAGDDTILQENIGCGWIGDCSFRINKKKLTQIMEIKINTLNVNLKDLQFHQTQADQKGWTNWERPGFTRLSTPDELADVRSDKGNNPNIDKPLGMIDDDNQTNKLAALRDINIGASTMEEIQTFKKNTLSIWEEIMSTDKSTATPFDILRLAAERFRIKHQKVENAFKVIQAMFVCSDPNVLTIIDFAKFMSKFGPEATLMEKIDSLVKSSNANNDWLCVKPATLSPLMNNQKLFGYFDEVEHNCVILHRNNEEIRIWNMVNISPPEAYLVDSNGERYKSWQHYFEEHPYNEKPFQFGTWME